MLPQVGQEKECSIYPSLSFSLSLSLPPSPSSFFPPSFPPSLSSPPLHSLHRYHYPFFGCPYPVLVQPPVTLSLTSPSEHTFTQSFCSFDFAASYQQLFHHTSQQPLLVEVWQSCDHTQDRIAGVSQVRKSLI